jgi:hypothetical protein
MEEYQKLEKERDQILKSALDSESNYCDLKDSLQAHNLEQQAKGRIDGVAYVLNMYCTHMKPSEFPDIGKYYASKLKAKPRQSD